MTAEKNNEIDGKPEVSYLHPETLRQLSYALQAGARKYGKRNYWKGHSETVLLEAIIRHAYAYLWDQKLDEDTSERIGQPISHLGCILANINMLLTQEALGTLKKDLPRYELEERND